MAAGFVKTLVAQFNGDVDEMGGIKYAHDVKRLHDVKNYALNMLISSIWTATAIFPNIMPSSRAL